MNFQTAKSFLGRWHKRIGLITLAGLGSIWIGSARTSAQSAADFLYSGRLAEGETALLAELQSDPNDDNARFGLGVIQFGRALENMLQELNRHGFLTERTFGPVVLPELREYFPDDPDPKAYSHDVFRRLVVTWVDDITKAEATLAGISDPRVQLHLKPALIQIDPVGKGKPVSAVELLALLFPVDEAEDVTDFELTLDRGDVHWLRGYLHLQAALGEFLLALDFKKMVEIGGHRLFEKVETPHDWLLQEDRNFSEGFDFGVGDGWVIYIDYAAILVPYLDIPVIEPERFKAVIGHLAETIENGQKMWEFILAESDDNNEWIPNPNQKGRIGVAVNQEMIDTWLETLKEAKLVLAGEKLVPFWRDYMAYGKIRDRGINVRKVFDNPPKNLEIVLWIQGTAATPYLERGEMTLFADEEFLERINRIFGSNFLGFAAWFN